MGVLDRSAWPSFGLMKDPLGAALSTIDIQPGNIPRGSGFKSLEQSWALQQ